MSRATISTGNITVNTEANDSKINSKLSDSCHILIMANFSGGLSDKLAPISKRKIVSIDRDNFDDVFSALNVKCQVPLCEQALAFKELDDMHPDYLYENLPLFDHLKTLKRQLKSSAKFAEAAAEIYQWHELGIADSQASPQDATSREQTEKQTAQDSAANPLSLDDILSNQHQSSSSDQFNIAGLIKSVVAPYVEPKPDPQQKELIKTVDMATSELMRKLMHHSKFQSLESTWRSLYMLVKRIETNQNLKVFIVDITEQELMKDALLSDTVADSQIYKLIVSNRQSIGSTPFSLIMHDAIYGNNLVDINSLNNLSEVADACDASLVIGGTEKLAGCKSLHQTPDRDDWDYQVPVEISEAWDLFRASKQATKVIAVSPRYLSRMPYGKKTSPITSFEYEELTNQQRHRYYLWSNGAWLVTLLAAQSFSQTGAIFSGKIHQVDQLPLHVYDDDGESVVTPCAEIHMTDSTSHGLRSVGLTSIRSIVDKDSVLLPNIAAVSI